MDELRDTQYNLPIGTDLISRQAAIDVIDKEQKEIDVSDVSAMYAYSKCKAIIKQLPSAQPKRGKWIGKYPVSSICSECGYLINDSKVKVFAFCPNCGADMRGEQNE